MIARVVRELARSLRRGAFAIGTGVFLGLIAAFGLVAPVFVQNPIAHATPADALPPCPAYQALLDRNLNVLWANDPSTTPPVRRPVLSTIDYARLVQYPDQQSDARKELLAVRPSRLGPAARTAWAINVHNFLVIDSVVGDGGPARHQISTARDIDETHALVRIEGKDYSLRDFDQHFLFADRDSSGASSRTPSTDPRIYFALITGARGGPPLHPKAYRPETLTAQLEDVTRGALLGSKHLRWNAMTKELAVSPIFETHASDFGGPDSAFAFVMAHIPPRTADQVRAAGITKIPGYIDMDWALNQTPTR